MAMSEQRPVSVLVVEDDAALRASLEELFVREGFSVALARDGAEAITLLEEGLQPCAVLVDLIMPGVVGQELLEYIETTERLRGVPVAIVSGVPELAPAGYRVFKKPVPLRSLIEFIHTHCPGSCQPTPPT